MDQNYSPKNKIDFLFFHYDAKVEYTSQNSHSFACII